jgi:hypothetical protein
MFLFYCEISESNNAIEVQNLILIYCRNLKNLKPKKSDIIDNYNNAYIISNLGWPVSPNRTRVYFHKPIFRPNFLTEHARCILQPVWADPKQIGLPVLTALDVTIWFLKIKEYHYLEIFARVPTMNFKNIKLENEVQVHNNSFIYTSKIEQYDRSWSCA